MVDALVFDLDGTLWDASESSTIGWNNGLRSLNSTRIISVNEMNQVTGKPFAECAKILCPEEFRQHQNLLEVLSRFETLSIKESGGKLYDNLEETIHSLSQKYDLFLVSNCQQWYLEFFLEFSGLGNFFKDCDCNGKSKQNKAEMLINLKEKYRLAGPVYIGDTESDEFAAKNAGYSFIYAGYGFGKVTDPDLKINSLRELVRVFK